MSAKQCGHHHRDWKKILRYISITVITASVILLVIIFLTWLILHPAKPQFTLQDATVRTFNLSAADGVLTTSLHVTLSSRNPNGRIGIYYDRISVYAAYHSQQITLQMGLPPGYQGHKDIAVWSPILYGVVSLADYLRPALYQDGVVGKVLVNIRVDGRIRWKVGSLVTGRYHLYVNCPAYISLGKGYEGGAGDGIKYQFSMGCNTDV